MSESTLWLLLSSAPPPLLFDDCLSLSQITQTVILAGADSNPNLSAVCEDVFNAPLGD